MHTKMLSPEEFCVLEHLLLLLLLVLSTGSSARAALTPGASFSAAVATTSSAASSLSAAAFPLAVGLAFAFCGLCHLRGADVSQLTLSNEMLGVRVEIRSGLGRYHEPWYGITQTSTNTVLEQYLRGWFETAGVPRRRCRGSLFSCTSCG